MDKSLNVKISQLTFERLNLLLGHLQLEMIRENNHHRMTKQIAVEEIIKIVYEQKVEKKQKQRIGFTNYGS